MGQMDDTIGKILELNIPEEDDEGRNSSAMTDYSDEDDEPFELAKGNLKKLQSYFHQMDRELAGTEIGKSFERKSATASTTHLPTNGHGPKKSNAKKAAFDDFAEDEDYDPVDVKLNLVKNMLNSCASEKGMPGPASNLLKRMGVELPADVMDSDDE